jgi:3-oxoacyl-[acyl-carrier-protein] synthase II
VAASKRRRVVVTGVGAISPLGNSVGELWAGLRAGRSGIGPIARFDASGFGLATTFAGEVRDFDAADVLGRKDARRMDRYSHFALAAAMEAVGQAGLSAPLGERVGVLVGSALGGIETIEAGAATLAEKGPKRLSPFFMPALLANMASGNVAIWSGAKGPNFATVSACASSAHAIGEAVAMIRAGAADAMLAGGAEATITPLAVAGFNAMGALSTRNERPAAASRPFDAGRDGFVMAEGGAMLVLEERERAAARGAEILAEITGYATTDDANHMVQPAPGGEGAARAIGLALGDAGLTAADVEYVNAHGTSTQLNERLETAALKAAFGEHAHRVAISSTKSMTGHLLGAAGSVEAVACVCALREGCIPPTINYETPDPDCDLDYVPNEARTARLRHVVTTSMGFGGHNAVLVLSAADA